MICSQKKWRAALAALLLAALPGMVASASPAAGPLDVAGSVAEWVEGWADGWLARLVPTWATAGSETAPDEPPATVAPDDGVSLSVPACDATTCTEGDTLPDWEPNG
jgi:hypothetical protein